MTVSRPVTFLLRLTVEEHEAMRQKALELDLSMAQIVRHALKAWLTKN